MIPSLVKFLDENKEFIDEFTPTPSWFIELENKLMTNNPVMYRNFFAEISFDILAMREPEMAVITHDPNHRYGIGIKFSDKNCWAYSIFSVVFQKGNIGFEELKEQIKQKVSETVLGLDKSPKIIRDLIDSIPEERMVEI